MVLQATLAQEIQAVGIGLHTGNVIRMGLKPAPPRTGIVFSRTDLAGASVKASVENINFEALQLATTLYNGEVTIQTTEHLLSAFYSTGISNAFVELDGPEVPIMDGSAAPFLTLIEEAGIKSQRVPWKTLVIEKPFLFEKEGKKVEAKPANDFQVTYEINFNHPLIQSQRKTLVLNASNYEDQIAPARTFGFLRDVNFLKERGLIKGGSLDNAIVLDGDRMLNEKLRLNDEFVSHKILDLIGDLSVSGFYFQGHFNAVKAGHEVHACFLRALLEAKAHYSIVEKPVPERDSQAPTFQPALTPSF